MITHYLSHPFSGDETKNRAEAEAIQRELQEKYPDVLYISPIANFKALESMEYYKIMMYCLCLLDYCDGIVMTGRYRESRGCMMELSHASQKGMPVYVYDGETYRLLSSEEVAH
ncbi:PF14359 domain protein [Selenomonas sp. FOBRC9]|uniref:DUF4406 domain-containing protein n=1 Tax=Selenomonas sp. FOBRC9 TaxID=936573 RepID=UPI00027A6048|nr:DUF4406 domain-containing protein [Selenomonas sp. FOBRC9]EJP32262.1 PF14359 domain protein [Selenomonas sp. FOBRC9]